MKRIALLIIALLLLVGCAPIVTPGGPDYRYSSLILFDWPPGTPHAIEGVQVGPKYDAHGTHWSVYAWWHDTAGEFHDIYVEGDELDAGSTHWFDLPECAPLVYCPTMDGRDLGVRISLPYRPPAREVRRLEPIDA